MTTHRDYKATDASGRRLNDCDHERFGDHCDVCHEDNVCYCADCVAPQDRYSDRYGEGQTL